MARLLGPDDGQRGTQRPGGRDAARGASVVVYAASSGDTLADILTEAGEAIPDSTVTTDLDYGLIPKFQFPDGVDTVYVEVAGGARTEVNARYEARVDSLVSRVATLETTTQVLDGDLTTIAGLDSTTAGALVTDGSGWIRKTYAQLKTALGLVKADVGLGNVDNTSDANKPISTATQTALDLKLSSSTAAGTFLPVAPDWITGRAYVLGELVVSGGTLYRTTTAHTSSGSFDATKFTAVGAAAAGDLTDFVYAPVGGTTYTTTSTTTVDVDATNLLVTFTTPDSGVVWLQVNAAMKCPSNSLVIAWREGSTTIASQSAGFSIPETWMNTLNFRIAGLTPGSVHTYKLAWRVTGGTGTIFTNDTSSPITIRVTPGK